MDNAAERGHVDFYYIDHAEMAQKEFRLELSYVKIKNGQQAKILLFPDALAENVKLHACRGVTELWCRFGCHWGPAHPLTVVVVDKGTHDML